MDREHGTEQDYSTGSKFEVKHGIIWLKDYLFFMKYLLHFLGKSTYSHFFYNTDFEDEIQY